MANIHKAIVAITLLAVGSTLTACNGPGTGQRQTSSEEVDYSHITDMPNFSGPWAEEFRNAYAKAPNDEIRAYLRDENITEAEKQAVTEAFRTCLSTQGVGFTDFDFDGGFSTTFEGVSGSEEANRVTNECAANSGVDDVIFLYFQVRANPQNRDLSREIAMCMVRSETVTPSFTAENYRSNEIEGFAASDVIATREALRECQAAPLEAFND
ncbi:hypothetical protein ICM05_05740 [Leucobacter sp. cx-42]|uniref:hypothetical protein n=1 Tax=unclassified Leucobacter TaxID=2621730 RepID=UPI00165EA348|nr:MULTISPECIES: hypothetical protein [unclassified Leucobacter]MBC9954149.1 hypothetical protein [Leucobacter sp. cx-42]